MLFIKDTIMRRNDREKKEILRLQVRLFCLACKKWKLSITACADLFDRFRIDHYIDELYDLMHLQGDEANLYEIESMLKTEGVMV